MDSKISKYALLFEYNGKKYIYNSANGGLVRVEPDILKL